MNYDCIVVGGGAAGLSATLVLGRARRRVLLLDLDEQSNRAAHGIGGLLGFDGRPPAELYAQGRAEIAAYPTVEVREAEAVTGREGFVLTLAGGEEVRGGHVLLATGMRYALPALDGVAELWGDTVFHCPFCHGWEARDGRLAVYGAEQAEHRALLLRGWSDDVVLLTDGPAALDEDARAKLAAAGVVLDERPVAGLRADGGRLAAIGFADGSPELGRDGLMVFAPLELRSTLPADLGVAFTPTGAIDVDGHGQTTVPGLWAAGDVAGTMPSVAGAIAAGHKAGAMVHAGLTAEQHGLPPMVPPRDAVVAG